MVSTARTMIETNNHLKRLVMKPPVCIGLHGIFANNTYTDLLNSGAARVVTSNTIPHPSNAIDVSDLFVQAIDCQIN
jgi:ribose-phosphate pyrophosphokinase